METEKGFIFLEIVIAVALVAVVFTSLLQVGALVLNVSAAVQSTDRAAQLLKGEMESVRSFRDGSVWNSGGLGSVATGSQNPYYLSLNQSGSPASWQLQSGTETVQGFGRKVVFDLVSRDPLTHNIESAYNASHDDPNTRKVTVTVSRGSSSWQTVAYLTNWNQ